LSQSLVTSRKGDKFFNNSLFSRQAVPAFQAYGVARRARGPRVEARGHAARLRHHLDRCGEMLGPMLASIHNLHYYLNLMREVREALDEGRFEAFRRQFHADRARGVG
jgi:queuine tRNA-ribosyltransferase